MKREFGKPLTRTERQRLGEKVAIEEAELIEEIAEAAEKIASAMGPSHELVYRTDPVWRLLSTIERAHYCCSLSDVARLMKISRQHAQRLGFDAARAGLVELAPNDHDRRIVQLLLTKHGRAEIARARHHRRIWTARLLLGLDTPRLTRGDARRPRDSPTSSASRTRNRPDRQQATGRAIDEAPSSVPGRRRATVRSRFFRDEGPAPSLAPAGL